jgi:O-antigen/teichoic acid export membrane protein
VNEAPEPAAVEEPSGRRISRNAAYNLLGWLVTLAANLIVLPYAVRKLGPEEYGVFLLITSVAGFLGLLELGLGSAIVKYVAEYTVKAQFDMAYRAISAATLLLVALGLVASGALYASAPTLSRLLVHDSHNLYAPALASLRVATIGVFLTMAVSPLTSVPQALQRYDVYNGLVIGFSVLNAVATVVIIALGYRLMGLVVMTVASTGLVILSYVIALRALLPGFRFSLSINRNQATKLLAYGGYTLVGRVCYLINTQVFRVIVGVVLGAAAVTYFTVTTRAALGVAGVFASITNVLVPAASESHARGDLTGVLRLLRKREQLIAMASAVPFLILATFSGPILSVWMGSDFATQGRSLLTLLAVAHYLFVLAMTPNSIALGAGYAKMVGYVAIATTTVMCLTVLPLARAFGIAGVGGSVVLGAVTGLSIRFLLPRALARETTP